MTDLSKQDVQHVHPEIRRSTGLAGALDEQSGAKSGTVTALLQTRCGCARRLTLPDPPPTEIEVDLVPLPGHEREKRTFQLVGSGTIPGVGDALLYREIPPKDAPRIVVPTPEIKGKLRL